MDFVFEATAALEVRRTSASLRGSSCALTPSPQKSRPIRPANRPVNALMHDQEGLPGRDIDARIPLHKSGSFVREEVHHA